MVVVFQAILKPHKCYLRVLSHVLDCFWLKYGNRVPKLDAPAFKDHRVEAKMRARGDGAELDEGSNNNNNNNKKAEELTKEQKMERMKQILAKMKSNKEEKESKKK